MYRAFATREPNNEFSPGLSMQAIDAYRKGGFTELVLEGKREYVALYNYGTPFWPGRNKADYPNIAKELKTNLKDVATYFHAEAQKTKKVDQYREAARWYRTYLESFPDDPDSFGTNYLLSEALYESAGLPGCGQPSSPRPPTTIRATRVRPQPRMRRSARTPSTKRSCRPPRRPKRTRSRSMPASSSAPAFPSIPTAPAC